MGWGSGERSRKALTSATCCFNRASCPRLSARSLAKSSRYGPLNTAWRTFSVAVVVDEQSFEEHLIELPPDLRSRLPVGLMAVAGEAEGLLDRLTDVRKFELGGASPASAARTAPSRSCSRINSLSGTAARTVRLDETKLLGLDALYVCLSPITLLAAVFSSIPMWLRTALRISATRSELNWMVR